MLAQRATQQTLRRRTYLLPRLIAAGKATHLGVTGPHSANTFSTVAAGQPSMISQFAMKRALAPVAIGSSTQIRPVATQKLTPEASYDILAAQRKNRPTSPHLTIYRPQIPWILSMTHRITGGILSTGFYLFGTAYLVSPLFGWHLDSASLAAVFASWPAALKVATKFTLALPFTFHGFNGIRHLVWDMAKAFNNRTVIKTGWTIVGLSVTSALALAVLI